MRIFSLSLTTLISFFSIACGDSNSNASSNNSSKDKTKNTQSENKVPRVKKAKIGESISNSFSSVTLLEALKVDKYNRGPNQKTKESPDGKDFLLIKAKYKNIGDNKLQVGYNSWGINNYRKVTENNSNPPYAQVIYDVSVGHKEDMIINKGNRLKSGESTSGWIMTKVPEKAKDFDLKFKFGDLLYDANGDGDIDMSESNSKVIKGVWDGSGLKELEQINFTHKEKDYKIPGESD